MFVQFTKYNVLLLDVAVVTRTDSLRRAGMFPARPVSTDREGPTMRRVTFAAAMAAVFSLAAAGAQAQQYPMLDEVAARVVQKYQASNCQQIAQQRMQPPSGQRAAMEQRLVRLLHEDPQARAEFINRVAAPIANKLFECGLIP